MDLLDPSPAASAPTLVVFAAVRGCSRHLSKLSSCAGPLTPSGAPPPSRAPSSSLSLVRHWLRSRRLSSGLGLPIAWSPVVPACTCHRSRFRHPSPGQRVAPAQLPSVLAPTCHWSWSHHPSLGKQSPAVAACA